MLKVPVKAGEAYFAEHSRKTEHWGGRQRTQSKDTLQRKAVGMMKKSKEERVSRRLVKVVKLPRMPVSKFESDFCFKV
jgi:hypothetical protein